MKKYFLSIAVLMMALVSFTACSDDNNGDSGLEKTTWAGKTVDEDDVEELTISFSDSKNGIQYAKTNMVDDDDNPTVLEVWTKCTYTFNGKGGTVTAHNSVMKIDGVIVAYPDTEGSTVTFKYDEAKNTITFDAGDGDFVTLSKTKYQDIVFPTK